MIMIIMTMMIMMMVMLIGNKDEIRSDFQFAF